MVQVTRDEAMALREKYGKSVGIATVNRQKKSKRKHYYVEETSRVFYFLERFREKQLRKNTARKGGSA